MRARSDIPVDRRHHGFGDAPDSEFGEQHAFVELDRVDRLAEDGGDLLHRITLGREEEDLLLFGEDPGLGLLLCIHIAAEPGQTIVIRDPVPQHFLFDAKLFGSRHAVPPKSHIILNL